MMEKKKSGNTRKRNARLKFFSERKATANGAKLCDLNSLSGARVEVIFDLIPEIEMRRGMKFMQLKTDINFTILDPFVE
jgi:hypothetical protein